MSVITMDYIPFDYMCYAQEVLPALEQATQGSTAPLHSLLASATHFSLRLRSKYTLPLSKEVREQLLQQYEFKGLLDVPTLRRAKYDETWNPWDALAAVIPSLEGRMLKTLGRYGELLKFYLLATFCCEVPPRSESWWPESAPNWIRDGPVIWHDEVVFDWRAYCARDTEAKALWETFYRSSPTNLAQQLHLGEGIDDRYAYLYEQTPRYIRIASDESISGFMTLEEIQTLLEHVRVHERPLLDSIIDGCIRDGTSQGWTIDKDLLSQEAFQKEKEMGDEGVLWHLLAGERKLFEQWMKVHPMEMGAFLERYYQRLWTVEDEILYRMRFATSHDWGMLILS